MDLEERTLETVGEHCEECGAKLTEAELRQAMESGGPALCTSTRRRRRRWTPTRSTSPARLSS